MKLKDLTDRIAEQLGYPKREALWGAKAFLDHLAAELADKGEVFLAGFGTFRVVERGPRKVAVKLPTVKPGTVKDIPARRVVVFKPHAALKSRVA